MNKNQHNYDGAVVQPDLQSPDSDVDFRERFGGRAVVVQTVSSELQPPDLGTDSGGKNDASPDDASESLDEFDQNDQKATRE